MLTEATGSCDLQSLGTWAFGSSWCTWACSKAAPTLENLAMNLTSLLPHLVFLKDSRFLFAVILLCYWQLLTLAAIVDGSRRGSTEFRRCLVIIIESKVGLGLGARVQALLQCPADCL